VWLALLDVWGAIVVKVKVYSGPETLLGVKLATGGFQDAMQLSDVFLCLSKECGFGSVGFLPNEEIDIVDKCFKGLF